MAHHLKKSSFVGVRFLPEEKQKLQEVATRECTSLSNLIRLASLRYLERTTRKSVPEINRKVYFELGLISERIVSNAPNGNALLDLHKLLNEVRRELLGLEPIPEDNS